MCLFAKVIFTGWNTELNYYFKINITIFVFFIKSRRQIVAEAWVAIIDIVIKKWYVYHISALAENQLQAKIFFAATGSYATGCKSYYCQTTFQEV